MKLSNIDSGKSFDWGNTSESYAKYRDIYPLELYKKLRNMGVGRPDSPWLDMGTGTGVLPFNLYQEGSIITGIDIAYKQIEQARRIAGERKLDIKFLNCPAEDTKLPVNYFDVITAAQCFMYFNKKKIVTEIRRLLKKDGLFVKIYMGWLKKEEIVVRSQELVKKYNQDWLTGKPMIKDMKEHLFPIEAMESFYSEIPFSRESWTGRMKATRGVEAAMTPEQVADFEIEHNLMMAEFAPPEFTIKHKVFITIYRV